MKNTFLLDLVGDGFFQIYFQLKKAVFLVRMVDIITAFEKVADDNPEQIYECTCYKQPQCSAGGLMC